MIPWLDGLLKLVTYPADTLPGRLGRRIRRVRRGLRKAATGATAQITTLASSRRCGGPNFGRPIGPKPAQN